jgi:carboxyl-terminal processing protease
MFQKIPPTVLLCLFASAAGAQSSKYFDISKNLEIFTNVYREINHSYVDELDPATFMRSGLDAMLGGLDPFTNYISETDIEGYRYIYEGKYQGLGAEAKKMGDYVVISEILEGSPAQKAGLKVGDAFLSINNQSAKGRTAEEVLRFLRGFPGTKAELVMRRPGEDKELRIAFTREEMDAPNVPHSGIVAENIGYINLNTFTRDAGDNVADALRRLKSQHPGLKGVILDLRDNGGGLLNEAVNVSNVFLPRGTFITSTKGKVPEWNREFRTERTPVDEEIKLVVLINKMSASASEIVSGSLQDLDRGVLMGQRSYGKGLVQNTKDVGYNSKIKLTTAKYYIPSGRCIQSVQYKNGEPVDIPESERARFKTRGGRTVLDGGGVKPDVLLPVDSATGVVKALLEQNIIFDYVTEWALKNPTIDSIETFQFQNWDAFSAFVQNRRFTYVSDSEKKLQELKALNAKETYLSETDLTSLETKIQEAKNGELERNKARIIHEIEQEIVGRFFFQRGKVRKKLKNDPDVEAAVQLLNDSARYEQILSGK